MDNGWALAGYLVTFGGIALYLAHLIRRVRSLPPRPSPDPASDPNSDPEE